jgi:hypothetical protein
MSRVQIPSILALLVGVVMLVWGSTLQLHQKNVAEQTTGEFILSTALTTGGVLIAVMACYGMSRRTRRNDIK